MGGRQTTIDDAHRIVEETVRAFGIEKSNGQNPVILSPLIECNIKTNYEGKVPSRVSFSTGALEHLTYGEQKALCVHEVDHHIREKGRLFRLPKLKSLLEGKLEWRTHEKTAFFYNLRQQALNVSFYGSLGLLYATGRLDPQTLASSFIFWGMGCQANTLILRARQRLEEFHADHMASKVVGSRETISLLNAIHSQHQQDVAPQSDKTSLLSDRNLKHPHISRRIRAIEKGLPPPPNMGSALVRMAQVGLSEARKVIHRG